MFKPYSKPLSNLKLALCAAALGLFSGGALAQVQVENAWVRSVVAGQKVTGAFMQLTASKGGKLLAVESPLAGHAEMHEMSMAGQIMKMREVTAIDLPPQKLIELKPGAYHIMLFDLKQRLNPGETVPMTLTFEDNQKVVQKVNIKATVRDTFKDGNK